jgi:hypothetical protein
MIVSFGLDYYSRRSSPSRVATISSMQSLNGNAEDAEMERGPQRNGENGQMGDWDGIRRMANRL